jgi:hypothetical protein
VDVVGCRLGIRSTVPPHLLPRSQKQSICFQPERNQSLQPTRRLASAHRSLSCTLLRQSNLGSYCRLRLQKTRHEHNATSNIRYGDVLVILHNRILSCTYGLKAPYFDCILKIAKVINAAGAFAISLRMEMSWYNFSDTTGPGKQFNRRGV